MAGYGGSATIPGQAAALVGSLVESCLAFGWRRVAGLCSATARRSVAVPECPAGPHHEQPQVVLFGIGTTVLALSLLPVRGPVERAWWLSQ